MQRDIKVGLTVVGILLLVLGGATYRRLSHVDPTTTSVDAPPDSGEPPAEAAPNPLTVMATQAPIASQSREHNHDLRRGDRFTTRGAEELAADRSAAAESPSEPVPANPFRRASAESPSEESGHPTPALFSSEAAPRVSAGQPAEADEDAPRGKPLRSEFGSTLDGGRSAGSGVPWSPPERSSTRTPEAERPDVRSQSPTADGKYTVQPNDNYWVISEKVYGTGAYFKAIHEHNRANFPRASKLQVGDVLEVPAANVLAQNYPELCPKPRSRASSQPRTMPASAHQNLGGKLYTVEEGDTLFDIARYELGKASRWGEIYELNRDAIGEDFDYLRAGTQLTLPASGQDTDSVTRQGHPTYQR